jgi:prepilin-type N-terminal cleavage/methylation domain-containing protein
MTRRVSDYAVSDSSLSTSSAQRALPCRASGHRGLGAGGFSLIEVVAAVAVFAIGFVGLLGLLAPVTKSVANVEDTEAAALVADAVRARLQTLAKRDFTAAAALLQDTATITKNDGSGTYNPNDGTKNPAVIFAHPNGNVAIYDATQTTKAWYYFDAALNRLNRMADADKYFEIELVRNENLSPKPTSDLPDTDNRANLLAYTMRVRWPSFVTGPGGTAIQIGSNPQGGPVTFDHSKKQVLFFTGTIRR